MIDEEHPVVTAWDRPMEQVISQPEQPVSDRVVTDDIPRHHGEPAGDAPQTGRVLDDPANGLRDQEGVMPLTDDGRERRLAQGWLGLASPGERASPLEFSAAKARCFQRSRLTWRSRTLTLKKRISRCLAAARSFHFCRLAVKARTRRIGPLIERAASMLESPGTRLSRMILFQHESKTRSRPTFRQPSLGVLKERHLVDSVRCAYPPRRPVYKIRSGGSPKIGYSRTKVEAQKLKVWLHSKVDEISKIFNIDVEPPCDHKGQISTIADSWSDMVLVSGELRSWSKLWVAATGLVALEKSEVPEGHILRPRNVIFPRLMSRMPDVERLRELGVKEVFEAGPGQALIVGRLKDLRLRCYAADYEGRDRQSRVAGELREDKDLIHDLGRYLYAQEKATEREDQETQDFDLEKEAARLRFEDPECVGPEEVAHWENLSRGLLDSLLKGMGHEMARTYLLEMYGLTISATQAERYWSQAVRILRDFKETVTRDQTASIAIKNLGCAAEELDDIQPGDTEESGMAALRNVIAGKLNRDKHKLQSAFTRLRSICRNPRFKSMLSFKNCTFRENVYVMRPG